MQFADVELVSGRGVRRPIVDNGIGVRCPKLDMQITVADAALAHSSRPHSAAAESRFLDVVWWHLELPRPPLPDALITVLGLVSGSSDRGPLRPILHMQAAIVGIRRPNSLLGTGAAT